MGAIEGDYIETKKDNLIFDVKGIHHPKERPICFIRFYPDRAGDRKRGDKSYRKIYDLHQRYEFLKKNYPNFLFYSEQYNMELQGVKNDQIKRVFKPREHLKELDKKITLNMNQQQSLEICNLFKDIGNLPEDSIGVTGSQMVGLNTENSDIDLIIYGTEVSLKFQESLPGIFNSSNKCRKYNFEEYKNHYKFRAGGSEISFNDFMKSEIRKLHQGKFHDTDFFIRYIKSPKDWKGTYYDYKYKNYGRIKIKAQIINSSDSIFTPCTYKIQTLRLLDESSQINNLEMDLIQEINSFRGRFCEQAKTGEMVMVEGKLEQVEFKNEEKYFRILLGNQIKDKMIIIS